MHVCIYVCVGGSYSLSRGVVRDGGVIKRSDLPVVVDALAVTVLALAVVVGRTTC